MFSSTMLVQSEKADDLKTGLILLRSNIQHLGPITVITDSGTGFVSLANEDKQLKVLDITITTRDDFNKNFNAIVDHACQELEVEIRKLDPEAGTITQAQLSQAVLQLNSKLRRKSSLAAYEIHAARNLHSGDNLTINDTQLHQDQLQGRQQSTTNIALLVKIPQVGDTVTPLSSQPKHVARNMYPRLSNGSKNPPSSIKPTTKAYE